MNKENITGNGYIIKTENTNPTFIHRLFHPEKQDIVIGLEYDVYDKRKTINVIKGTYDYDVIRRKWIFFTKWAIKGSLPLSAFDHVSIFYNNHPMIIKTKRRDWGFDVGTKHTYSVSLGLTEEKQAEFKKLSSEQRQEILHWLDTHTQLGNMLNRFKHHFFQLAALLAYANPDRSIEIRQVGSPTKEDVKEFMRLHTQVQTTEEDVIEFMRHHIQVQTTVTYVKEKNKFSTSGDLNLYFRDNEFLSKHAPSLLRGRVM